MTQGSTPAPPPSNDWIIGTWQLLRHEAPLEFEPGTRMGFSADHTLEYLIPAGDGVMQATLRWQVKDGVLHTTLEDGTNPVQAGVALGDADVLTVTFGGPRAWFVRAR